MIIQALSPQGLATWKSRMEMGQETAHPSGQPTKAGRRTGMLMPAFLMEESEHGRRQRGPGKAGMSWERNPKR